MQCVRPSARGQRVRCRALSSDRGSRGSRSTQMDYGAGARARAFVRPGPMDRTAVPSEGLRAPIERESARRLARLGGAQPSLKAAPRRRLQDRL